MTAKTIALVGANGFVGKAFAKEFLNQRLDLRILARDESIGSAPLQEFESRGASLHAISYDHEPSIVNALRGVDVLISTVTTSAVSSQFPLIKAAKTAGIKLFFPSDYGCLYEDPCNDISPFIQIKRGIINTALEIGLPYAVLTTGGFPEFCFVPPLGYKFAEKKVDVWGDGNAKSTWTTVPSVADWIANVLKTVPIERLQNKRLCIQGNVASANEVVRLWEEKHNVKLEVQYHPVKDLEDRLNVDKNDFLALALREWSSGRGKIGGKDNGLYPGWKPESIESGL